MEIPAGSSPFNDAHVAIIMAPMVTNGDVQFAMTLLPRIMTVNLLHQVDFQVNSEAGVPLTLTPSVCYVDLVRSGNVI